MKAQDSFMLPPAASSFAQELDVLFNFILYLSLFAFVGITLGTIYLAVRYRRKEKYPGLNKAVSHHFWLETVWTVIPAIVMAVIFVWGSKLYLDMTIAPSHSMELKVTGQRWFWTFDYPTGVQTTNEMVLPIDKPVRLLMSSKDVLHSFYVPAFRTKFDVLPNRYTQLWFTPTMEGEFPLYCAEYCGTNHSSMIGIVRVLTADKYSAWLDEAGAAAGADVPLPELGAKLYKSKTCFTCHTDDGGASIGPSFKGRFGQTVIFTDGSKGTVDENYLRESILNPNAKVADGYQPIMPTFQGMLDDRELDAIIAYIKSLQ